MPQKSTHLILTDEMRSMNMQTKKLLSVFNMHLMQLSVSFVFHVLYTTLA